jgi:hypothetical protein
MAVVGLRASYKFLRQGCGSRDNTLTHIRFDQTVVGTTMTESK